MGSQITRVRERASSRVPLFRTLIGSRGRGKMPPCKGAHRCGREGRGAGHIQPEAAPAQTQAAPAQAPVVPQIVPDQLSIEAKHLREFRKYNAKTFDGSMDNPTKSQMWLMSIEIIFRHTRVISNRSPPSRSRCRLSAFRHSPSLTIVRQVVSRTDHRRSPTASVVAPTQTQEPDPRPSSVGSEPRPCQSVHAGIDLSRAPAATRAVILPEPFSKP
ncbi:histone H2B.3-like [Cucumis melo var. makuwa]|uniref:Histone H2B.3-like n=1 Tax=Cucumis melo var. makuwa TaxID=1194695 RepID=A0A5D3BII8_CUCMM|nr:histone H2B.3-like [Cucumis melo var. makuwa]